jgi:hypothetical protein
MERILTEIRNFVKIATDYGPISLILYKDMLTKAKGDNLK